MLGTDFHFLRPLWFLALFPAFLLVGFLWFSRLRAGQWSRAINADLLPHLIEGRVGVGRRWPLVLLLTAWLVAIFSLAGPVWRKLPQEVRQKQDVLVLIQDLSLSFYAQDLPPDRLTRAQHKLADILDARKEGLTALIVYAGDAHVVSPLTDDTATIAALVPELEPGIMPSYGSNLKAAVELSLQLLADSSVSHGRLLLLTDEVEAADGAAVTRLLRGKEVTLSVLGVGTATGGPIPKGDGGFLQDGQGRIVVPRLESGELRRLAADNGGRYRELTLDDGDFNDLLGAGAILPRSEQYRQVKREFDQWREEGYWLVLPLLALALLGFRRGWLIFLLVLMLWGPARPSAALEWRDLWQRRDQQAARALAENQPQEAARLFQDPQWRGVAEYRAGNYGEAVKDFSGSEGADAYYNRGNGLAKGGRLEEAVQAYEQALRIAPDLADALANKQLVEQLLKQRQEQHQQAPPLANPKDRQNNPDQGQGQAGSGKQEQSGPGQNQERREQARTPGAADKASQASQQSESGQGGKGQQRHESRSGTEPPPAGAQGQAGRESGGRQEKQTQNGAARNSAGQTGEPNRGEQPQAAGAARDAERLSPEQQQAQDQVLRLVPDNPGGLLRRKFEYQSQINRQRDAGTSGKIW